MKLFCADAIYLLKIVYTYCSDESSRFSKHQTLPERYVIHWARIYTHLKPAMINYDNLGENDIGFKVLDNGNYSNYQERLRQLPYIFKRSEMQTRIRTSFPQTLYLRNKIRLQDYMIEFEKEVDLRTFLNFFPDRKYDDSLTASYYFILSDDQY